MSNVSGLSPSRSAAPYWSAKSQYIGIAVAIAFFALAHLYIYPVFLMKAMCLAIFAMGVNLLLGYGGLLSFGHAAFFGMSGYLFGHIAKEFGLGTPVSLVLAVAGGTALGALFGVIAIRRLGFYFAMSTLALAQMVYFFCVQAPFTGGEDGLQAIPRGSLLGFDLQDSRSAYWLVFVAFSLSILFVYRVVNSPFGDILKAIRENEARTVSLGYKPATYKLIAFILSAFLASSAGALKALVFQIVALSDVHWTMSGDAVLMALVGGIGTLLGPTVGALFIVAVQDGLAEVGLSVVIIQGLLFMACVSLFRRGIVGEIVRFLKVRL